MIPSPAVVWSGVYSGNGAGGLFVHHLFFMPAETPIFSGGGFMSPSCSHPSFCCSEVVFHGEERREAQEEVNVFCSPIQGGASSDKCAVFVGVPGLNSPRSGDVVAHVKTPLLCSNCGSMALSFMYREDGCDFPALKCSVDCGWWC